MSQFCLYITKIEVKKPMCYIGNIFSIIPKIQKHWHYIGNIYNLISGLLELYCK